MENFQGIVAAVEVVALIVAAEEVVARTMEEEGMAMVMFQGAVVEGCQIVPPRVF